MSFGEKLTKLRKERGMSQEDLASNLNVSRQAVSKWESNNSYPETEKIVAICKLFNCSMDELIGLKEGKVKKDNKIFNIINEYFDKFLKAIKMFYSMTFKQKIKCCIEMFFYFIVLFVIFLIAREILIEIIRKLLYLLPSELLMILIQTFDGLFDLVYVIFMIYALAKLYKVRYLDYYENYLLEKDKAEPVITEKKETKVEKINIKEEKIIIRDANNEFKPFSWIKKACIIFIKLIALSFSACLGVVFVLLVAFTIFTLYFLNSGLLIFYITIFLIGALLGIYILIEIFIKFIFNMEQKSKRLFIMFIIAMIIVGVSFGLFVSELTTYSIIDKIEYNTKIDEEIIEMQDNLLIGFLNSYDTEIIYEEREDILIEYYSSDYDNLSIEKYSTEHYINCSYTPVKNCEKYISHNYYISHYLNGKSFNEVIQEILKYVQNKEIISDDVFYYAKPIIHISKENYDKLINNQKLIDQDMYSH